MTLFQKNYKVVDLFCGAGGLSLGFKKENFDIIYALDNDETAIKTYNNYFGNHGHCSDIEKIKKELLFRDEKRVDVIIGGPPCQGFSVQRRGRDKDKRNNLVLEYARLVLDLKPKIFLMENVSGLLSKRGKLVMETFKKRISRAGYSIFIEKINAADYGVPQNRVRVFLIGVHKNKTLNDFEFPVPAKKHIDNTLTVRDAIFDLMKVERGEIPNHIGDKLSEKNLRRIRSITQGQGRDSLPEELQLPCHTKNKGHRHLDTYGRMSWDEPSPTLTARFDSFSRGRFGHPVLDRSITLREGARLQTFPDNFIFFGNKVDVAKQIGNAVPPKLAQILAKSIKNALDKIT
jgi:DNA (cytosine-5)-methyltransferase 1